MRRLIAGVGVLLAGITVLIPLQTQTASANEMGGLGAAPVNTWQTNATVWQLAYANGAVYAAGDFTSVRPPGVPRGTSETARKYAAAFSASTGAATSFNHSFTRTDGTSPLLRAVASSPDGSVVYYGGSFDHVDGVFRNHIAAFSTSTGALLTTFHPSVSGKVTGIATYGDNVYIAGDISTVNGVSRSFLAAVDVSGNVLSWAPTLNDLADAIAVSPDGTKVYVGGYFTQLNGSSAYNKAGVVDATTGASLPFPADSVVPVNSGSCVSNVKDIVTAGDTVYFANEGTGGGCLDGTWAAYISNGAFKWENQCLGATQTVEVVGNWLYKGSHIHDCITKNSGTGDPDNFPQIPGYSRHLSSERLDNGFIGPWYPNANAGPNLGPRAMTTDGTNLWVGGDFTTINGVGHDGFAEFTPGGNYATPRPASILAVPAGGNSINVFARTALDYDDPDVTVRFYRDSATTPFASVSTHSLFWSQSVVGVVDNPGSGSHTYKVDEVANDGSGTSSKSVASNAVTAGSPLSSYAESVIGNNPSFYWRLDEPSSSVTVGDTSSSVQGGAVYGTVTRGVTGGVSGDTAMTFDGSTGNVASGLRYPPPATFSEVAWIKTTTTRGGKIIGFGNNQNGASSHYDKHIYMTNGGLLTFGVYAGGARTVSSSKSYNDGRWHEVVATQGSVGGISLYVDGVKVAGNTSYKTNENYVGFWRLGGDSLSGWPSRPSSDYFSGSIDDVAVYPRELTATQVAADYLAGTSATAPQPPSQPTGLSATAVSSSEIDLSWNSAAGASSYTLQRAPGGSSSWATVQSGITGTTFQDRSVAPVTAYDYRVAAVNSAGTSAYSAIASATTPSGPAGPPDAVTGLTADDHSATSIRLSWDPANGATSYVVESAPSSSGPWSTAASGVTGTSYTDTGLSRDTTYFYRVHGTNGQDGPDSAVAAAATPLLSNGLEGGSDGSAVTSANSGAASGDAFNAVSCSSGSVNYSTARAADGGLSALLSPTTSTCFVSWTGSSIPSATDSYGRAYLYITGLPASSMVLVKMANSTGSRDAQINMDSAGHLRLIDALNGKQAYFSSAMPMNQWVRLEWHLVNSTASGSLSVQIFANDALTPLETETSSNINTGSSFASVQFGQAGTSTSSVGTALYVDDLAYGTQTWLGRLE